MSNSDNGAKVQGVFKGLTTDVDHRSHADDTGLNAGEKAAATRAARYGDELHFASGEKAAAVEEYQKTQMGKATPQNDGARADHPLSMQKNKNRQKGEEGEAEEDFIEEEDAE